MAPKGASTQLNPIRLQSVARLKIKRPDKQEINPCLGPMSAMLSASRTCSLLSGLLADGNLGCWASSGYSVQGCAQLEQTLRECMDAPVCESLLSILNRHHGSWIRRY
jgi:hypothetical protein